MKQRITRRQKDISRLLREKKKSHRDILRTKTKNKKLDDQRYNPDL
ncbi:hypothetical protein ACFL28_00490 [Candidatus Omnitrophota bacterium]